MNMSPCPTKSTTNIMALSGLKSKYNKFAYLSSQLESTDCKRMPVGFLTPADFYKSLLASAVLQQQQQHQQRQSFKSTQLYHQERFIEKKPLSSILTSPTSSPSSSGTNAKESKNVSTVEHTVSFLKCFLGF